MSHHAVGKPDFMSMPDFMPVLSRGKHRTPRSGGCFMEFASYLAGESWSDHPACTHPQLASLARMTNDCTSDAARSKLAVLIPTVIGLNGDDPRIAPVVALRAATSALPVANMERQRALAVGILTCENAIARMWGPPIPGLQEEIRAAFALAPDTEPWAHRFIDDAGTFARAKFTSRTADSIVRTAVQGIAEACDPDTDGRLNRMLAAAIDDCVAILETPVAQPANTRSHV